MQAPVAPPRPLISDITIEHGPVDLLGRFFLKADTAARRRDVHLSFAPMQDLVDVNHRNHETWRPLLPLFDPAVNGGVATRIRFCILGRNALRRHRGDAGRAALSLGRTRPSTTRPRACGCSTPTPQRSNGAGEAVEVTAPAARRITGRVVFAGGVWYRPDYRGRQLPHILPRISRAYAYTRWQHDYHTSIMAEEVYRGGMAERSGYTKVDWEVMLKRTVVRPEGDVRCALVWMDSERAAWRHLPTS